jgi:transcriptional regulator with XRE-family HTH domain
MKSFNTTEDLERNLGKKLTKLRLQKNITRETLSTQAGVSITALRNLEGGKGATIKTLLRVVRALNREDWIESLAPIASINPLQLMQQKQPRQRARSLRTKENDDQG